MTGKYNKGEKVLIVVYLKNSLQISKKMHIVTILLGLQVARKKNIIIY